MAEKDLIKRCQQELAASNLEPEEDPAMAAMIEHVNSLLGHGELKIMPYTTYEAV